MPFLESEVFGMEATIQSFNRVRMLHARREQEARARRLFRPAKTKPAVQTWTPQPVQPPQPIQPPPPSLSDMFAEAVVKALWESYQKEWAHRAPESLLAFKVCQALMASSAPEGLKGAATIGAIFAFVYGVERVSEDDDN